MINTINELLCSLQLFYDLHFATLIAGLGEK